jgi:PAS domain-containing protein
MCPSHVEAAEPSLIYRWSDELDEGILIMGPYGAVAWLNEYFLDMVAVGRETAIGLAPDEFMRRHLAAHLPDEASVGRILDLLLAADEQQEIFVGVHTARGEDRLFSVTSRVMRGEPYRGSHLVLFRKIAGEETREPVGLSESKRMEEQLQENETKFRAPVSGWCSLISLAVSSSATPGSWR